VSARWPLLLGLAALAGCRKDDAPAHLERARVALFENKPDLALAEYKQALDLLEPAHASGTEAEPLPPRDPGLPPAEQSMQALYRARALRGAADVYNFQLRDFKHAVQIYRELIALNPESPETLEGRIHLASLLRHEYRDLPGAIAELNFALARNPPQSAELSYQVAVMYFEHQDYEQCQLEAANVARKFETSAWVDDALFLRAQALSMMEDRTADAQRSLTELVQRFPDSELKPHALFELGRLSASTGDSEKAIEYWVQALKTHPDPKVVQANIARVRSRLRATTPATVGDATRAFDWDKYPVVEGGRELTAQPPGPKLPPPKTSLEAVGGSKEEAEREAKMSAESGAPKAP
jgi:tetratricopeptide (TPR) repeat protein